ncbi:MAG: hypothetical protein ABIJ11_03015 [Elusimicrobiota bacterium]
MTTVTMTTLPCHYEERSDEVIWLCSWFAMTTVAMTTLPCHYEERSDEVICFVDEIASLRSQ